MKLVSVVGARPQFIKAAVLSRALRKHWDEVLVHTGQHYDDLMSDVFFRELGLPVPDLNLGVGSGSHAVQTARMLEGLEAAFERERPDIVIVYGDTNSTLAGALAAAKLRLPVAHVEAGFRSYERDLPEEINRVLTDHAATHLFCATNGAVDCLAREGITHNVHMTGDLMYDSLLAALLHAQAIEASVLARLRLIGPQDSTERGATTPPPSPLPAGGEGENDNNSGALVASPGPFVSSLSLEGEGWGEGVDRPGEALSPFEALSPSPRKERGPGGAESPGEALSPFEDLSPSPRKEWGPGGEEDSPSPPAGRGLGGGVVLPYYLATVHRAATTDDANALARVLNAFALLDSPVVLPLHPRTAAAMRVAGLEAPANVRVIEPVGYFEMLALERNARAILTDSGGVRREAYWLAVPCVTLREESEWPETVETGWDVLAGTDTQAIVRAAQRLRPDTPPPPLFGDGHAADKIVEILRDDPSNRRS